MLPIRQSHLLAAAAVAALVSAANPPQASAQHQRPSGRSTVHAVVYRGPVYRQVRLYQWGGPYRYPPYAYRYSGFEQAYLRVQVTPREAEVFVDGYHAGRVDDFDGVFQRLRLPPGGHEITIFLEGYNTVREAIYLEPGAQRKLQFSLSRLAPGQRAEPPSPPDEREPARADRDRDPPLRERPATPDRNRGPGRREGDARYGSLFLRVQPSDAEVFIDGELWAAGGREEQTIRLAEGRHRVEVRRAGAAAFMEDVLIRPGATLTLNVSLK